MKRFATASAACLVALAAVVLAGCSTKPGAGGGTRGPAPGNVELVAISAAWNPACRMQAPLVEKLAKDYAGRAVVRVIDVEAEKAEAETYGAKSYPTFVLVVEGTESRRLVGLQSEKELRAALDRALGPAPPQQ
ncbi:MAG: thioredoxin family protein [Planctomycetota bacterium]|jgi:thiol-disulfide isomerase/thioredoxin